MLSASFPAPAPHHPGWLAGGGAMGALLRTMDWAATPLGPVQDWPPSLHTALSLCLASPLPLLLSWGAQHIQVYNDAYRPYCGALHPASLGAPFEDGWASTLPPVAAAFARARGGDAVCIEDQRIVIERDGAAVEVFVNLSFSPIRDESGTVVGVFHPLVETGAGQQELRRLAAALAEKNRMQSDFLFTLAHELRNPLAPIRSGLDLLRLRPDAEGNAAVQAMMRRQVDHMVHLVDDLLDMARLSEGKLALHHEAVSLTAIVSDAVEISMPLIEAGRHQLGQRLPLPSPLLHIDRHRMVQVLSNLLNNAARYTPAGGRIAIEAAVEDDAIVIAVSDNGIGIDAAMLPLVFDMYAQAHRRQGLAAGGLGVGLNLVRRLVELHGGTVSAQSAGAGQGSRFSVSLPLAGAQWTNADGATPAPAPAR